MDLSTVLWEINAQMIRNIWDRKCPWEWGGGGGEHTLLDSHDCTLFFISPLSLTSILHFVVFPIRAASIFLLGWIVYSNFAFKIVWHCAFGTVWVTIWVLLAHSES